MGDPAIQQGRMNSRRGRKGARWRFALGCAAAFLLLALLVMGGGTWWLLLRAENPVSAGSPVQLEIAKGMSTAQIAAKLAEAGVVRNPNMFRVRARALEADGQLKAGVYDLTTGMDYDEVILLLREGPPIEYANVTIPEGFVLEQIAERFEQQAGIPAVEFLALAKGGAAGFVSDHPYLAEVYAGSLEGYLFPKTYRIPEGTTAREVIEMMLNQFEREISTVDFSPAEVRGKSLEEIVIIASIIERETRVASERPVVSSVIYNRLERNMRLEIDATIEYVLPGTRFRLRNSDLEIDSPYNTYRNAGLTPGPICNPGLASIEAAVAPQSTNYIYYVLTDPDGSHTFTETFEEFLVAKAKSKEVFGR